MSTIDYYEVKPTTPISKFKQPASDETFAIDDVAPVVGLSVPFIRRVVGPKGRLVTEDVVKLIEQDSFAETFVPRSRVVEYLLGRQSSGERVGDVSCESNTIIQGDAVNLIRGLRDKSVQCVVTSTPYWAMRVYDEMTNTAWADGECCPFGLEQTPEGFIRHSVEVLYLLRQKITVSGSVWWDIMDTFNTRTQIRSSAVEALRAMQGKDVLKWSEHPFRRYSAGHSYLKDGEQCLIPFRIAERASRIGYFVKSIISWCKSSSLPEPQLSRVSRNVEYVLHLTVSRTPKFKKDAYLSIDATLGGRQSFESEKLSDFWYLPTSAGRDGHGAQFPIQLPGRCIALSTDLKDLVLDPFAGAGTSLVAAKRLNRKFIGFDLSNGYVELARKHLKQESEA